MAEFRCQVTIPAVTSIAEDALVNVWGVAGAPSDAGDWAPDFAGNIKDFYDAWATYRSTLFNWAGAGLKVYRLSDPKPRAPRYEAALGLVASKASTTLPTEVAVCLSFQALQLSGAPQARRRGRIYLGPFGTNAAQSNASRPDTGLTGSISLAAKNLLIASDSNSEGWKWAILSPTGVPGPTEAIAYSLVDNGWVDDAWDTQRRRGLAPATKFAWTRD